MLQFRISVASASKRALEARRVLAPCHFWGLRQQDSEHLCSDFGCSGASAASEGLPQLSPAQLLKIRLLTIVSLGSKAKASNALRSDSGQALMLHLRCSTAACPTMPGFDAMAFPNSIATNEPQALSYAQLKEALGIESLRELEVSGLVPCSHSVLSDHGKVPRKREMQ